MSLVRNGLVALVVLQIGSGCALFRPDPTPPAFERISLQGQVEKTDDGKLEGDTHSDSALKGVTIGFVSGGITGGGLGLAYGAVACVPTAFFYPICLIVAVFVGVVVGAPTGMVLGGATGLPWKTTGEVDTLLANISRSRDFQREFQEAVMAAVPPKNQVPPGQAEALVTARVDEIDLRQHLTQQLSLRMFASLVQEWPAQGGGERQTRTCEYEYTSQTMDVEDWLMHDGKLFNDTLTEGMHTFAGWMARDLEAFSTRRAEPETDFAPATCFQVEEAS